MLGRNGNTAYVRYDHQGRIVPGGPIIQAKPPKVGNWQAVSNVIGTNTTSNALRAFIRIDYFNRVVPSSLVLLTKEPGDNDSHTTWLEINAQYRGSGMTTTTTSTTVVPTTSTTTSTSSSTSTTTTAQPAISIFVYFGPAPQFACNENYYNITCTLNPGATTLCNATAIYANFISYGLSNADTYIKEDATSDYRKFHVDASGLFATPVDICYSCSSLTTTTTSSTSSTTTTTTTTASLFNYSVNYECDPVVNPTQLFIIIGPSSNGVPPYDVGFSFFDSEAEALANTEWRDNAINPYTSLFYPSPISVNSTYWVVARDGDGTILAKSITTNCDFITTTTTTTIGPSISINTYVGASTGQPCYGPPVVEDHILTTNPGATSLCDATVLTGDAAFGNYMRAFGWFGPRTMVVRVVGSSTIRNGVLEAGETQITLSGLVECTTCP